MSTIPYDASAVPEGLRKRAVEELISGEMATRVLQEWRKHPASLRESVEREAELYKEWSKRPVPLLKVPPMPPVTQKKQIFRKLRTWWIRLPPVLFLLRGVFHPAVRSWVWGHMSVEHFNSAARKVSDLIMRYEFDKYAAKLDKENK